MKRSFYYWGASLTPNKNARVVQWPERFSDKEDPVVKIWAHSSAVERFSDKEEVEGSTPSVPTKTQILVRGTG